MGRIHDRCQRSSFRLGDFHPDSVEGKSTGTKEAYVRTKDYACMFFFGLILIGLFGCRSELSKTLGKYGYIELLPPSRLVPPGTIVEIKSKDPLIVGVVCQQIASLSDDIGGKLLQSDSSASDLAQKTTATFQLEGGYLDKIKAKAEFKDVKDIKLSLSNVKVIEISDDVVIDAVKHRVATCMDAIKLRRANNQKVSMVKSVLQADVVYTVETSSSLSVEAKADITEKVKAELGGALEKTGTSSLTGNGLYWGVRDDEVLAQVTAEGLPKGPRVGILPSGATATVVEERN
jgi:hypothetical protein